MKFCQNGWINPLHLSTHSIWRVWCSVAIGSYIFCSDELKCSYFKNSQKLLFGPPFNYLEVSAMSWNGHICVVSCYCVLHNILYPRIGLPLSIFKNYSERFYIFSIDNWLSQYFHEQELVGVFRLWQIWQFLVWCGCMRGGARRNVVKMATCYSLYQYRVENKQWMTLFSIPRVWI
jgi:hypothetical protein